jgi:hypothetical protein
MSIAKLLTNYAAADDQDFDEIHLSPADGVYLPGPQADFLKSFLSTAARVLQDDRQHFKVMAQECHELAEEGTPEGEMYFNLLNDYRDGIRETRAMEKKINSVIRALKNR